MNPSTSDSPLFIDSGYEPSLPPSLPEGVTLTEIGVVTAVYEGIVKSLSNKPILDRNSALYLSNREPLGMVYEVIGSTRKPAYVIVHENKQFKPKSGDASKAKKLEVKVAVRNTAYYVDDEQLSVKALVEDLFITMRANEQGVGREELVELKQREKEERAKIDELNERRKRRKAEAKQAAAEGRPFGRRRGKHGAKYRKQSPHCDGRRSAQQDSRLEPQTQQQTQHRFDSPAHGTRRGGWSRRQRGSHLEPQIQQQTQHRFDSPTPGTQRSGWSRRQRGSHLEPQTQQQTQHRFDSPTPGTQRGGWSRGQRGSHLEPQTQQQTQHRFDSPTPGTQRGGWQRRPARFAAPRAPPP